MIRILMPLFLLLGASRIFAVEIELTIIDSNARQVETPVANAKVWLIPHTGPPLLKPSDRLGRVRFVIPETAYVCIRVGTPPDSTNLPRMSGRFDQKTSLFVGVGTAKAAPSFVEQDIRDLIDDLRDCQLAGELSNNIRNELKQIRSDIIKSTEPNKADPQETQRQKLVERQLWVSAIDRLLRGPWKLGVTCAYTQHGAVIKSVAPGSVAESMGIEIGNLITKVDDLDIGSSKGSQVELTEAFSRSEDGQVSITWQARSTVRMGAASSIQSKIIQLTE